MVICEICKKNNNKMHNQCKQIYKQKRLIIPKLGSREEYCNRKLTFTIIYAVCSFIHVHVWEALYSKISSLSTAN